MSSNTFASLSKWALSAVVTPPWLIAASLHHLLARDRPMTFLRAWARFHLKLFCIDLTVEDRNHSNYNNPPYLFVHLNQASLLETFLYFATIPVDFRPLINIEFALIPSLGSALIAHGARVLIRQSPKQSRRQITRATEELRRGHNYGLSIEGRRSKDGTLSPFKQGPARLAIDSGATMIPFITLGARERWPYGDFRVGPGPVRVIFCKAIPTDGLILEHRHALTAKLRNIAEQELR